MAKRNWIAYELRRSKRFSHQVVPNKKHDCKPDANEYFSDECEPADLRSEP